MHYKPQDNRHNRDNRYRDGKRFIVKYVNSDRIAGSYPTYGSALAGLRYFTRKHASGFAVFTLSAPID